MIITYTKDNKNTVTPTTQVKEKEKSSMLKIRKLQMAPDQLIYISEKALEKYPLYKYREGNYYPINYPGQQDDMVNIQEETESVKSDNTKIYWLLD